MSVEQLDEGTKKGGRNEPPEGERPPKPSGTEPHIIRFAKLVRQMRAAQSRYFQQRNTAALNEARDLERRVDQAIAYIFNPPEKGLFDDE